jgi:hypothetical protein
MTDNLAGPAFHAAFIGEDNPSIRLRCIARRRATVDALLTLTLQANIMVDNPNMRPVWIDIEACDC